jgi:multiple sugar transport system permease protein
MLSESKFYKTLRYILLFMGAAFVIVPLVPVLFMAFKTGLDFRETPVFKAPADRLNLYNFACAIRVGNLFGDLLTTLVGLGVSLFFSVNFSCMVSFVLQRFEFRGKKLVMGAYLLTMFIPVVTTQVVVFRII